MPFEGQWPYDVPTGSEKEPGIYNLNPTILEHLLRAFIPGWDKPGDEWLSPDVGMEIGGGVALGTVGGPMVNAGLGKAISLIGKTPFMRTLGKNIKMLKAPTRPITKSPTKTSVATMPVFNKLGSLWDEVIDVDEKLLTKISNWIKGVGEKPTPPSKIYRGVPVGEEPVIKEGYTHASPWQGVSSRGGKGGFGDPRSYEVYETTAEPSRLYYRGGALAESPLERTRIMNEKGMTWDEVLDKGKALFVKKVERKNKLITVNNPEFEGYTTEQLNQIKSGQVDDELKRTLDDIRNATFETDITNKPGKWVKGNLPRRANRPLPQLLTNKEIEEALTTGPKITDILKSERGSISNKPLTKAEQIFTPEYRKSILEGLATTPERKELLQTVLPTMEELISNLPKGSKAYVTGSYPAYKPAPSDLDWLVEFPSTRSWGLWGNNLSNKAALNTLPQKEMSEVLKRIMGEEGNTLLHTQTTPPIAQLKVNPLEFFRKGGQRRYGSDYDIIRVLGVLLGMGSAPTIMDLE